MNVGDRIRLLSGPACLTLLGMPADQVGIIKNIDATRDRPSVLISFPDADVYVSALRAGDIEVVTRDGEPPGREAGRRP